MRPETGFNSIRIILEFIVWDQEHDGFMERLDRYLDTAWKYGISAMSGPVGVTVAIGSAAKRSIMDLLPIMALITINLGIFNLLPLPALDGGRIMFILFEMIFRKPVPQKYEAAVHAVGFALLIALMLLITAKDIFSLITG